MCSYLNSIIHAKGEGVMLRRPRSLYEHGKSRAVLKAKVSVRLCMLNCLSFYLCCSSRTC